MKYPFQKKNENKEESVWADWLSDDATNKNVETPIHKAPQKLHFPNSRPNFSQSSKPSPQKTDGPRPLVIDPHKFQEQRMRAFVNKQAHEPHKDTKQTTEGRKEISLSINFPSLSLAKIKQWRPSRTFVKRSSIILGVVLVIGLMTLTPKIIKSNDKTASKSSAGGAVNIPKSFAELKPEDAQNVSNERYDPSRGFYAFNDRYKSGNVTVTEQPLPDNVRDDEKKGKELAKSVGATDEYETTQGMLYLTLSDKKTAQRAVLIHRQLLIFIQSTEPLDPTSWVDYVQSLN